MTKLSLFFKGKSRPEAYIAVCVFIIITALYTLLAYQQWIMVQTKSWDLGIFTQLVKSYAAFQAPIVPIKGEGFNLFGDHFHPILVLLAPFYWIFPSAFMLLVAQAVLFAIASAIFGFLCFKVFKLIVENNILIPNLTGRFSFLTTFISRGLPYAGGIGGGLAFGVSYGLESAAAFQFHEIAFALPLLSLALYYFILSKYLQSIFWGALLVFVKEDLGLTVFMLGLIIAWRIWYQNHKESKQTKNQKVRKKRGNKFILWMSANPWIYGILLAAWGLFWTWFSTVVILPLYNIESQYDYTSKSGVSEALKNPLGAAQEILTNNTKMWTLILLIIVSAGAMLFSSISLLALPTLAWRFLSPETYYWGNYFHYDAVLMPITFFCLADLVHRIYQWYSSDQKKETTEVSKESSQTEDAKKRRKYSSYARKILSIYGVYLTIPIVVVIAIMTVLNFSETPVKNLFFPAKYEQTENTKALFEAIDSVPENALVETDISFMNFLVDKESKLGSDKKPINTLYWTGSPGDLPPDYVAQNTKHWSSSTVKDVAKSAMSRHQGTSYKLIYDKDGVQIAEKVSK